MVDRLNSLASYGPNHDSAAPPISNHHYAHQPAPPLSAGPPSHDPHFNPRSISFDVRSPEELAAVNHFLLTLGRNIHRPTASHPPSTGSHAGYHTPPDSFFDPVSLGIAGMPGAQMPSPNTVPHSSFDAFTNSSPPTSAASYSSHHYSSRPHYTSAPPGSAPASANMYPHLNGVEGYSPHSPIEQSHRRIHVSTSIPPHAYHQPSRSPNGVLISPAADSFDYIRATRQGVAPTLAPADFSKPIRREAMKLRSLPTTASPLGSTSPPESEDVEMDSASRLSTPAPGDESLYPLLTEGNSRYKLAPFNSPPSSSSSSSSSSRSTNSHHRSTSSSSSTQTLPSLRSTLRSVAASAGMSSDEEDNGESTSPRLQPRAAHHEYGMRAVVEDKDQRRQHAELIKRLIITINEQYKRNMARGSRETTPTPAPARVGMDVEMACA